AAGAAPLPPPRPRNPGSAPSPPPAPVQPAPTQPSPAASPTDQECLAGLQKLGFTAEAVGPPPASEAACVIDQPVRLRSLRLSAEPVRDITFPDGPVVACRFADRFGHWVGDLAAVLVRGQLGTELKAVPTGVGFECRKRNRGFAVGTPRSGDARPELVAAPRLAPRTDTLLQVGHDA